MLVEYMFRRFHSLIWWFFAPLSLVQIIVFLASIFLLEDRWIPQEICRLPAEAQADSGGGFGFSQEPAEVDSGNGGFGRPGDSTSPAGPSEDSAPSGLSEGTDEQESPAIEPEEDEEGENGAPGGPSGFGRRRSLGGTLGRSLETDGGECEGQTVYEFVMAEDSSYGSVSIIFGALNIILTLI